jgi:ribokinase
MSQASVVVVGSANMDLVLAVERLVRPGETVLATSVSRNPGGKGANQAVAASRAGAATAFLGAVGDDPDGRALTAALQDAGVDVALLRVVDEPSGLAVIGVEASGENSIVVAPGANATTVSLSDADAQAMESARVVLAQLEIRLELVVAAFTRARGAGVRTVLNAAPVRSLPAELWAALDVLVVNEHEAAVLADGADDPRAAAVQLLDRVPEVLVTLGAEGALYVGRGTDPVAVPGRVTRAVDTTGAGDTFCGVLVAALADGRPLVAAAQRANVAASLSVERPGAIPSIPDRAEVDRAMGSG